MGKMQWFGVNVGHDPVYHPADIAAAGFNSLRIVGQRHVYLRDYFGECQTYRVQPAMVICNESFAFDGRNMTPTEAAEYYAGTYAGRDDGRGVAVWMIGNETNGDAKVNPESGVLTADAFNEMARAFIAAIRARDEAVPIYAVGTVTGDPNRLEGYDFTGFTGLDNHGYAQWPETVQGMLGNYDRFDSQYGLQSRICSEFGWPDPSASARGQYVANMVQSFENLGLAGAWVYCWELAQHAQSFGIGSQYGRPLEEALQFIRPLGYNGAQSVEPPVIVPDPPQTVLQFQRGFARLAVALGVDVVGQPTHPEFFPAPAICWQKTTTGLMSWVADRLPIPAVLENAVLMFRRDSDGHMWVMNERTGQITESDPG